MRTVFFPLILALSTLLAPPARAERGARRGRPLISCDAVLEGHLADQSFVKPLISRFADVRVREFGAFRGYQFLREKQGGTRTVPLPELKHAANKWRIEPWTVGDQTFFLYDLGSRNLETDQALLHLIVLGLLQEPSDEGAILEASSTRRRDLRYLNQYQRALVRQTKETFGKSLANDPQEARSEILANADLFGVLDRYLKPSAKPRAIASSLVMAVKLTHGERRNYVKPSFRDLARELGYTERGPIYLPWLNRVRGDRVKRLVQDFVADFGDGPSCELGQLFTFRKSLREDLRLRLLREVFKRAQRRKCQTIVTSLVGHNFTDLHGFYHWRKITLADGRRENLFVLRVNSTEYNRAYARIEDRLRELNP